MVEVDASTIFCPRNIVIILDAEFIPENVHT